MEHMLVMLTPEQKDIFYSGDKHLIIKGPYGCGKTIIARKKLEMLSGEPAKNGKNEIVYFVCYDPRSALYNEIGSMPNAKVYCNKERNRLSEIITNINEVERNENFNLIVDEYDSEDLDKREAERLNNLFERKFQDSFVFLIPQSMEKNREIIKADKKKKRRKKHVSFTGNNETSGAKSGYAKSYRNQQLIIANAKLLKGTTDGLQLSERERNNPE